MKRPALITIAFALMLAVASPVAAQRSGGGGGGGGSGGGGGGPSLSFPGAGGGAMRRGGGGGGRGGGARGGGHGRWQGGHHGHHHHGGSAFYFYGSYGPWWYPGWGWYRPYYYSYYPYYYPYYPYYPVYTYPPAAPPWRPSDDDDDGDDDARAEAPPADVAPASYGLIRLEGVRDGAAVDLDGRFWLTADDLDDRWMALPQGEHRIAVRVKGGAPMERTIRIVPGRTHVLRFDARAERGS